MTWELAQLVHRYAAQVDEGAGVGSLFAPDGVLVVPDPPSPDPTVEHAGPEAVQAATTGLPRTFHEVVGTVFDGTRGRVACVAHHLVAPDKDLVWHVRYDDDYRQVDGTWLFARRALTIAFTEVRHVR